MHVSTRQVLLFTGCFVAACGSQIELGGVIPDDGGTGADASTASEASTDSSRAYDATDDSAYDGGDQDVATDDASADAPPPRPIAPLSSATVTARRPMLRWAPA